MTNLVTLQQVKTWLKIAPDQTTDDGLLATLISSGSQSFLTQTNRPALALASFTERRNGTGTPSITVANIPLQTVTSLIISNITVPASPDGVRPGFFNDTAAIYLIGGSFPYPGQVANLGVPNVGIPGRFIKGFGNVQLAYTAGIPNGSVTGEVQTVPASPAYQFTLVQAATFVGSLVVTYQNTGLPLTAVTGTPATGQYVIAANGVVTLSAGDASAVLLCSYATLGIPYDVQQCVFEMVGWAYKNRDRIGVSTQRFAENLSNSYNQQSWSATSKATMNRYTRRDAVGW